jgi:hypothetical protein
MPLVVVGRQGEHRHRQSNFYTACSRTWAARNSTVFAHESPMRSAGFDAKNRLYLFALTVPRSVFVVGATAVIQQVRRGGRGSPWIVDLLERKPPKLAAVALANKIARVAWKLMLTGRATLRNPRASP